VLRVIRQELGAEMEQIFYRLDPEPIGCASLAQVHKAWLKEADGSEGQMVALKVQHAWMSKHTRSDTLVMEAAVAILESVFRELDVKWIIPVFQRNIESELNFLSEASNMRRCAYNFEGVPGVRVPELVESLTTKRVLAMEFVHGVKVNDLAGLRAEGFDPALVGRELTKIFGEMVFCHGFVHCDPHPGNMLVTHRRPDRGKRVSRGEFDVVVLDHGLYREIAPAMRRAYCELWEAMILQDAQALQRVSDAMGVGQYAKLFPLIFVMRAIDSKVKLGDRMSKGERARVRESLGVEGFASDDFKIAEVISFSERIPRDLLFIIRTQNLVRALCGDLGFEPRQRFRLYASLAARGKVLEEIRLPAHLSQITTGAGQLAAGGQGGALSVAPERGGAGELATPTEGRVRGGVEGGRSSGEVRKELKSKCRRSAGVWVFLRSLNLEIRMLFIEVGSFSLSFSLSLFLSLSLSLSLSLFLSHSLSLIFISLSLSRSLARSLARERALCVCSLARARARALCVFINCYSVKFCHVLNPLVARKIKAEHACDPNVIN
jgi:hypothetical protein